MSDDLRLECLRLAAKTATSYPKAIRVADRMFAAARDGQKASDLHADPILEAAVTELPPVLPVIEARLEAKLGGGERPDSFSNRKAG